MKKKEELKDEKIEIREEVKPKKKNNTVIIIICVVLGILFIFAPFILLIIGIVLTEEFHSDFDYEYNSEYRIVNNRVIFEDERAVIKDLNGYYNGDGKYIVTGYIDNKDARNLFLYVDLYDSNNYIIGQKSIDLNLHKNKNYKFKIVYDEYDASEVVNFKISKLICD